VILLPAFGGLAGLIAGSFIATLVIRWPQSRTLSGRSVCDGCGRVLAMHDLVPLLSWVFNRGACRTCGAAINWRHPAIESVAGLVGAIALAVSPDWAGGAGALLGWQLLALAALDAEHFWLPDPLNAALAITGLAVGAIGLGVDLPSRVFGGIAGFVALFAIGWGYRLIRKRDGLGGGDPKLLGAIGCWLGWQALPFVLLGASGVGLIAIFVLLVRGKPVAATTRMPLGALMAIAAFPVWVFLAQY
jgi:leader peptidase (prepilin peptidase) / N-methyltransferase